MNIANKFIIASGVSLTASIIGVLACKHNNVKNIFKGAALVSVGSLVTSAVISDTAKVKHTKQKTRVDICEADWSGIGVSSDYMDEIDDETMQEVRRSIRGVDFYHPEPDEETIQEIVDNLDKAVKRWKSENTWGVQPEYVDVWDNSFGDRIGKFEPNEDVSVWDEDTSWDCNTTPEDLEEVKTELNDGFVELYNGIMDEELVFVYDSV